MKQLIPLIIIILCLVVLMASCGPQIENGAIAHPNVPQAKEQCAAQPELAWCKK